MDSISASLYRGIKSRPIYVPLSPDQAARAHLLLCDQPAPPADVAARFEAVETWVVAAEPRALATPAAIRRFRAATTLFEALRHRLARERIGLRLYALGTEAFIWDAAHVAEAAGMGAGEIALQQSGSLRRRVQCVHCKTITEDVTTSIVTCPGCRAALFVRDHFSRRLGAFQGVMVDAERPGEVPAAEPVYL